MSDYAIDECKHGSRVGSAPGGEYLCGKCEDPDWQEFQHSVLAFKGGGLVDVHHPVGTDPIARLVPELRWKVIKVLIIERY
jgi:hypothetical protein